MSDWITALQTCSAGSCDAIPKGFKTRAQIQKEFKMGEAQAVKIVRRLVESGVAEMQMFRIQTPCGVRPVPHYRIKKK